MKFFRNPFTATFLSLLLIFMSCQKAESDANSVISATELAKIHETYATFEVSINDNIRDSQDEVIIQDFENYSAITNIDGVEQLLVDNGVDLSVLDALDFYQVNRGNPDIYKMMVEELQITNKETAIQMFQMIELYDFVNQNITSDLLIPRSEVGCALAVTGTLLVTVSAIWITGGWALVVWGASKAVATASIIDACSDIE